MSQRIFFEQQVGGLCGQHCVNAVFQCPRFDAFQMAELAHQLDAAELELQKDPSAEPNDNIPTQAHSRPPKFKSSHLDDSGFFSLQVIEQALGVFGVGLVPLNHPDMADVMRNPTTQTAFICNFEAHWLTIRRIRNQWYNLDSTLDGPVKLSDTYLGMFLAQLTNEGYSIFVVVGTIPEPEPVAADFEQFDQEEQDDEDLMTAIAMSLGTESSQVNAPQQAILINDSPRGPDKPLNTQDVRQKREAFLARFGNN